MWRSVRSNDIVGKTHLDSRSQSLAVLVQSPLKGADCFFRRLWGRRIDRIKAQFADFFFESLRRWGGHELTLKLDCHKSSPAPIQHIPYSNSLMHRLYVVMVFLRGASVTSLLRAR